MLTEGTATTGTEGTLTVQSGNKLTFELKAGQSIWISDIPDGTTYTVKEVDESYEYTVKAVSVNGVLQNGLAANGTVTEYNIDKVDFTNGLADKGAVTISKTVTHPFGAGYTVPANLSFTATVRLTNGGAPLANYSFMLGNTAAVTNGAGEVTVSLKNGESIMLSDLPEGTIYTVTETNIPSGFTQKTAAAALTGTITDDVVLAALVNEYAPQPVSPNMGLSLQKNLSGREWLPGETFTFTLVRYEPGASAQHTVVATASASAQNRNVNIDLSNEVYNRAGTYRYILTENSGAANNGITYDNIERQFNVVVTDNDMDGKLEISSVTNVLRTSVTGDAVNGYRITANRFDNVYAPVSGSSVTIDVQKLMDTVNGGRHTLNGFKFALEDDAGNVIESTATDASGRAHFVINYAPDAAGETYEYELKEINNSIHGMTYDTTVYKVQVKITDNLDGTTSAAATVTLNGVPYTGTPEFTNLYTPVPDVVYLDALKLLEGRELVAGEFEFQLLDENRQELQTKTNAADGTVFFDGVTVDDEKDYVFYIVEKTGTLGGITYSQDEYRVVVSVVQDGTHYIEQSTTYYKNGAPVGGADFTNVYTAASAYAGISGTKTLTGREIIDGEFEFELRKEDGSLVQKVANTGGTFTFDEIEFTEAGSYRYTVSEVKGNKSGVTYDETIYNIVILVTDDGHGQLHAYVIAVQNQRAIQEIVFNNHYVAAPVSDTIDGVKQLENKTLTDGEFEFSLLSATTNEVVDTVHNNADGEFAFNLTFNAAGVYHYEIVENNTHHMHVSYDNTVYAIGYEVIDDGSGQLKIANKTVKVGDTAVNEISFTNVWNPAELTAHVIVNKVLKDKSDSGLGLDGFKFALSGEGIETATLTTDAEGKAVYTLGYSLADKDNTYTYKLTEVDTGIEGMTYDKTEYIITVKVLLGADGVLTAELTQNGQTVEAINAQFTNVYEKPEEPTPPAPPTYPAPENPIPQTGDHTNLGLWIALLFVGTGGVIGSVFAPRRKKEN